MHMPQTPIPRDSRGRFVARSGATKQTTEARNAARRERYRQRRASGGTPARARPAASKATKEARNAARRERYRQLRASGVTPAQARRLRSSGQGTGFVVKVVATAGQTPEDAVRTYDHGPQARDELLATAEAHKRRAVVEGADPESESVFQAKSDQWSDWSRDGFPQEMLRVAEAFASRLTALGKDPQEIERVVFGLLHQWWFGDLNILDMEPAFDEY